MGSGLPLGETTLHREELPAVPQLTPSAFKRLSPPWRPCPALAVLPSRPSCLGVQPRLGRAAPDDVPFDAPFPPRRVGILYVAEQAQGSR